MSINLEKNNDDGSHRIKQETFRNGARSMATGCRDVRNAVMMPDEVEANRDAR